MKKHLFYLFLIWTVPVSAFFPNPNFERIEKLVQIEIINNKIHTEILEKIKNTTSVAQKIQFFEPIPATSENIRFFLDARAENYEILNRKPMLETLFDKAKEHQDTRFFRFYDEKNTNLLLTQTFEISPEKEIYAKLTFDHTPENLNDFFSTQGWFHDDIEANKAEIAINIKSEQPIHHFFTTLPSEGILDRTNNKLTFLFQKENFIPHESTQLFWSQKTSPDLEFTVHKETFHAHFLTAPQKREISEITFLIDRSGSLYGTPWERIRQYLHFWLERLDPNQKIRVAFFDEEVKFIKEEFSENTIEFRKKVSDFIEKTNPHGSANLLTSLNKMHDNWTEKDYSHRALVLITDLPEKTDFTFLEKYPAPLIILDFSDLASEYLAILAHKSGGFYHKLFRTPWRLMEGEELWNKWKNWSKPVTSEISPLFTNEREILPHKINSISSPDSLIFVGRNNSETLLNSTSKTNFIPKIWANSRIAEILKTYDFENTDYLDALLAIGRTFGIKTRFFDEKTTRENLREIFINLTKENKLNENVEKEIFELEKQNHFTFPSNGRFTQEGIPFYFDPNENTWRHFNFFDKVKNETQIRIAPFSEAQKKLFIDFPEFVAGAFSIAKQVEFCSIYRCISVKKGERDKFLPSDRAFFRDFDPNHWALPYLLKLVEAGILRTEKNGKLHPNRPIDRGNFVQMLVEYLWGKDFPPPTISTVFSDIKDSEFKNSINFLIQKNIIRGYPDGTFRPLQSLTRAEAVKILLASKGFAPKKTIFATPTFPDSTGWEMLWINEAHRRGMISGFPDGTFRPHQKLTRAEAAKLISEVGG